MARNYQDFTGTKIVGFTKQSMPDAEAEAGRIPACLVVDTSYSMNPYADLLKSSAIQMIEAIASHYVAKEKVDLEVITFNTVEQVNVKIEAQEIYKLVDERTNKIKDEFAQRLNFECNGGTPTAYALRAAVDELRDRYEMLKKNGKTPQSPIMFFLSDGLPEVEASMVKEHNALLEQEKQRIKQLVAERRLVVVAVEVGMICGTPQNAWQKTEFPKMHSLMQEVTGLPDNRHVRQAIDSAALAGFFQFTSSLLVNSATRPVDLNTMDLRQSELGR